MVHFTVVLWYMLTLRPIGLLYYGNCNHTVVNDGTFLIIKVTLSDELSTSYQTIYLLRSNACPVHWYVIETTT